MAAPAFSSAADDMLVARQGDTVDELIWRERSLRAADLGRVLALNPGLADLGAHLPLGTAVRVPAGVATTPTPVSRPLIQLWD